MADVSLFARLRTAATCDTALIMSGGTHIDDRRNAADVNALAAASHTIASDPAAQSRTRHSPSAETRRFVFFVSSLGVLCGLVIRLAIHFEMPLPAARPVLFLLLGILQDTAVFALAASIVLGACHWARAERSLRMAFGAFGIAVNILQIARSQAVIFFGGAIRAEDLRRGVPLLMVQRSLIGTPGLILAASLLVLLLVMSVSWRASKRSDRRWVVRPLYEALFLLAALITFLSRSLILPGLAENPMLAVFVNMPERAVTEARARSEITAPAISELSIRELAPESPPRDYLDPEYPLSYLPHDPPVALAFKPNIVFVVLESLRAEEVGCYGADPPGLTPNIDELARDGIRVDPAYSAGSYTAAAEVALWYGLPPLPGEILMASRPEVTLAGLPEILNEAGWKRFLWIHNGDSNFYGRDRFYPRRGIHTVDGRSFSPSDPRTNWGFSDRALARNAVTALSHLQEPFASMILTVSNHHPFELPKDAGPPPPLPPRAPMEAPVFPGSEVILRNRAPSQAQTVHYSDQAVGELFRAAKQQPWFKHTIFIITGDHGTPVAPYQRPVLSLHTLVELRHRVPFIVYSPLLKGGQTIAGPASHLDILPTLFAAAGVTLPRDGIGANLLDPSLSKDRIIPMWDAQERTLTLASGPWYYHARYAEAKPFTEQSPAETLVNVDYDNGGTVNYLAKQPALVRRFRSAARIYLTVYPWLVVSNRSGVGMQGAKATAGR
ncbi:MAG TPA: LTA synthase family protein [Thermoanaerobaculia bacterium]|nr:LTA synthase family protein [Thermoanaerobaculia bacterium]